MAKYIVFIILFISGIWFGKILFDTGTDDSFRDAYNRATNRITELENELADSFRNTERLREENNRIAVELERSENIRTELERLNSENERILADFRERNRELTDLLGNSGESANRLDGGLENLASLLQQIKEGQQ